MPRVAGQSFCVCKRVFEVQFSNTRVHHRISDQFGTLRADDFDAIPLSEGHHQGMFDTAKPAIRRGKSEWREI